MKKKTSRILTLVLALALVIGATVAIAASAEGATAPTVISKNVAYEGNFSLMYAVDAATVAEAPVTLNLYYAAPAEGAAADVTYTAAAPQTITAGGADYSAYVFKTAGVAAKDMGDVFYVQAVDAAGNKGEVVSYSVAEYMLERLYGGAEITAKQKLVYEKSLELGAAAQDLLTEGETLISEWRYVKGGEDVLVNGKKVDVVVVGDELTLTYGGEGKVATWNAYNAAGEVEESYAATDKIVAEGNYTYVADCSFRGTGAYFASVDTTKYDGVTATELNAAGKWFNNNFALAVDGETNSLTVVDGALKASVASGEKHLSVLPSSTGTNLVFETDIMIGEDWKARSSDNIFLAIYGKTNLTDLATVSDTNWKFQQGKITNVDGVPTFTMGGASVAFTAGEWYNIAIVYDGLASGDTFTVYVNGEALATGTLGGAITDVKAVKFCTPSGSTGSYYLDNTYVGVKNRGFGAYASKDGVLDYTGVTATELKNAGTFIEGATTTNVNIDGTTLYAKVNTSGLDSHLIVDNTGWNDNAYLNIAPSTDISNGFVFETDFCLVKNSSSSGIGGNRSNKEVFQLFDGYANNSAGNDGNLMKVMNILITYTSTEAAPGGITGKATESFALGEWQNIRIEVDGLTANSAVRWYINGELRYEGTIADSAVGVNCIRLWCPPNAYGRLLLDNTYFGAK